MANDNPNTPDVVTQPHLGRLENNYKPHDNLIGYLSLAKVIKVHHKHNTVDVEIIKSRDMISSNASNEGKFGARVLVSTAHFDSQKLTSSGVIEPIQEGQLVVLAFLDGLKKQPIILGSFHDTWDFTHNILPDVYPVNPLNSLEEFREAFKYLRVFPSQLYHKVDGIGAVEWSHPSKTFLKIDPDLNGKISDAHNGYDHSNLTEKDPFTYETRSGNSEETLFPVKMLFTHRTYFVDEETKWTKFFLDSTGLFRITRDNNDSKLTYWEISNDGRYLIRRQNDSENHGEGENYTEIQIGTDGTYKVLQKKTDSEAKINVDSTGAIKISRTDGTLATSSIDIDSNNDITLSHKSGSYIKLDSNGDIVIQANGNVYINGKEVHLNG